MKEECVICEEKKQHSSGWVPNRFRFNVLQNFNLHPKNKEAGSITEGISDWDAEGS